MEERGDAFESVTVRTARRRRELLLLLLAGDCRWDERGREIDLEMQRRARRRWCPAVLACFACPPDPCAVDPIARPRTIRGRNYSREREGTV